MGSLIFTVTRGGDASRDCLVDYTTQGTGSNPVSADDHLGGVFPAGRITILAGQTTGTITIAPNPDSIVEPDETGLLTITSPTTGVTFSPATAQYTFANDDTAGGGDTIVYGPQATADSGYVPVGSAKQKISGKISDALFSMSVGSNADGSDRIEMYHDGFSAVKARYWTGGSSTNVDVPASYAPGGTIPAGSDFTLTHDPVAGQITLVVNGSTRLNAVGYGTPKTGTYARFQHNDGSSVTITRLA